MKTKRKAIVVGGGVIGLSSAIRLREGGWDVEIWAKQFSPHTTSNVAAAIWYPYRADPEDKVKAWGRATLVELLRLSEIQLTGVFRSRGKKVFHRPMGNPWWKDDVPFFRRLLDSEMWNGERAGYEFEVPVAVMDEYLPYLMSRFELAGGTLRTKEVSRLEEALELCGVVINCTGLGARELVPDEKLFPIRGEVVGVEGGIKEGFYLDTDNPQGIIYVIPRTNDCVLGGISDDGNESTAPDERIAASIIERCQSAVPAILGRKRLFHRVGLRPGRTEVRLEQEVLHGGIIIHNYGHGGSGMTLSWGCADEVLRLVSGYEAAI